MIILDILQLFGRLHPLVLHLPIGILAFGAGLIVYRRIRKKSLDVAFIRTTLFWGMATAVLAALTGYILASEGGYDPDLAARHQWTGIGTAALGIFLYLACWKKWMNIMFHAAWIMLLALGITGHLGGSMTHGKGFLTEPISGAPESLVQPVSDAGELVVYASLVDPILRNKCNSCHNESKKKGGLTLSTREGIEKGGDSGALFTAGNPDASLMLQRIHLEPDHKEHMPPKGKDQLNGDEITLLSWWIEEGAGFESRVNEYSPGDEVTKILQKYIQPERDVFSVEMDAARPSAIAKLEKIGFRIVPVIQDQAYLSAAYRDRDDLDGNKLGKLKKIAPQLVSLDLSNTNADDQMIRQLEDFPHLQKINLQRTNVAGSGLVSLSGLGFLEYLNLVGTKVDAGIVEIIARFPNLRKLYLWNTAVTQEDASKLRREKPKLMVDLGANREVFGTAALKPPAIMAEQDIFTDSLEVRFEINFPGVNLYYTLDGTPPDTLSQKYRGPFALYRTAEVSAFAQKEGWEASEITQRTFIKSKYLPEEISVDPQPHQNYAASGASSLSDFKKGTTIFRDGNWLGFEQTHFTVILDMGSAVDLSRVTVSSLESTDQWIFFPRGMEISVSNDGMTYRKVKSNAYPVADGPEPPSMDHFSEPFEPVNARYIKVLVLSQMRNPGWHPSAGEPCWVFVDEILVE